MLEERRSMLETNIKENDQNIQMQNELQTEAGLLFRSRSDPVVKSERRTTHEPTFTKGRQLPMGLRQRVEMEEERQLASAWSLDGGRSNVGLHRATPLQNSINSNIDRLMRI
ncbi:hypothetical protein Tco_0668197 [Tanacetum coccineum]